MSGAEAYRLHWKDGVGKWHPRGMLVLDEPGTPPGRMFEQADEAWVGFYYWLEIAEPQEDVFV